MIKTLTTTMAAMLIASLLVMNPSIGFTKDAKTKSKAEKKIEPKDEIGFEQKKALAYMTELEARMYRLSKLIQETQPDTAARLIMGVRKAREYLISDRMKEATDLLSELKLELAIKEEKAIITHLEELKKLLLTADISLELKLEQLRKLMKARETLNQLKEKEELQLANTEKAAKKKTPDKKNLEAIKTSEKRNQKSAENIEQFMREFGEPSAGVCNSLAAAGQCMGGACKKLGSSEPKPAAKKQDEALKNLSKANEGAKKLEQELRKEIEALVRQRVMDNLQDMITQQKQVRETTSKLISRVKIRQKQALLATQRLSTSENRIVDLCKQSIELCELTQFSVVLPVALSVVSDKMQDVSDALNASRADEELVEDEKSIEKDLQALLDAMKEASKPSNANSGGQCKGCKGNRNKLLSEVKMLRWMQYAVHQKTQKLDGLIEKKKIKDEDKQIQIDRLTTRQLEIDSITDRLHSMTCPHCLNGE